jgi:hypothetical protein
MGHLRIAKVEFEFTGSLFEMKNNSRGFPSLSAPENAEVLKLLGILGCRAAV